MNERDLARTSARTRLGELYPGLTLAFSRNRAQRDAALVSTGRAHPWFTLFGAVLWTILVVVVIAALAYLVILWGLSVVGVGGVVTVGAVAMAVGGLVVLVRWF